MTKRPKVYSPYRKLTRVEVNRIRTLFPAHVIWYGWPTRSANRWDLAMAMLKQSTMVKSGAA